MEKILSLAYTGLYVILTGIFLVLTALSLREELPAYARAPPFLRPVRRMAFYLYRKIHEYRVRRQRQGKELHIPGGERVRNDFLVMYPAMKARRREIRYQTGKIERLLLLLFAWILLAGGLHLHSLCSGILEENGRVEREETGGSDLRLRVQALSAEEKEEDGKGGNGTAEEAGAGEADAEEETDYGTYMVTVHARRYTQEEAAVYAEEILQRFPDSLLGNNQAPDQIRTPLEMPAAADVEPFSISWESSRYAVLDTDGSIFNTEYTKEQAEQVELTMTLTYAGYQFRKKMEFVVRAPVRSEEEILQEEIRSALQRADEESATGTYFTLPAAAGGRQLSWREQAEDISASVLLLGGLVCLLAWYAMDSRVHERTKTRSRQLAIDYPQLISKIVLYLGAGMSIRNVFYKCAEDYQKKRAREESGGSGKRGKKQEERCLYEEILLVCNELESGIPEAEAYMHFGRRCRSRQYTKLSSLLVQNLRRGNDTLLQVLQEEAQSSFEERKNLARELGEEAGTKLLLPMMIMLAVTMLIIIVPAYFSFSM